MITFFYLFLTILGCQKEEAECTETVPCGFGAVCVEGTCVTSSCATSMQCDMEQYCDQGACVNGCASDDDCYPGDICNTETASCETSSCTNSHVDCGFKEYCNAITGECVPASGYYCRECVTDSDCGGNGNVCLHWGPGSFCGVTCEVENDCPSGFTCIDVQNEDGFQSRQCATYCWLYINDRPNPPGNPDECAMEAQ